MKKIYTTLFVLCLSLTSFAQGWPANYGGVMLQGFYWDGYDDSQWTVLEAQADELSQYFKLVWIPQSANCGGKSMGYDDLYWFPGGTNYTSSFGTEEELRSMIKTFKNKGIGTIADVVINHRRNVSTWTDFPKETYKGVTYQLTYKDICSDDEAAKNGYQVGSNKDTGEGWDGMRDLDHKSDNVQKNVKAYLKMLIEDLGYVGFRYDMVKGYGGEYTKLYNNDAKPQFSVGECWDGTTTIKNWIDKTDKTSAAFDFQFRYTVRNAANNGAWNRLAQANDGNYPLISNTFNSGSYKQYAVTFVENHDTEKRPNAEQDPLKKDTLAANAYLLAMPGTPCVFMTHWQDCKQDIKSMIDVRYLTGIQNTSSYTQLASNTNYYAVSIEGSKAKLLCVVGKTAQSYSPSDASWVKVLSGYHYAYYVDKAANTAWISHASGSYEGTLKVLLSAVTNSNAKLVYTTNGSDPTASSTQVASGTEISIPKGTTTLKVGLLVGSTVSGIQTRTYTVTDPSEFTIPSFCTVNAGETCAFFESPATWSQTTCWAWSTINFTGGSWPGIACVQVGTLDNGNKVWKWTWDGKCYNSDTKAQVTPSGKPTGIIFSNNGSSQTADLVFENAAYYNRNGQKMGVVTGINLIRADVKSLDSYWYDLRGRRLEGEPTAKGVYIHQGRKILK
ncbi:MAG: starch-binding protein [Prevotella sp.]|nr:starch-binding protein [Prevotella sp.]